MRQSGLALLNYEGAHQRFPSGWRTYDPSFPIDDPGWGWSATILPFMDGQNIHSQIEFNMPIDDPSHVEIIKTPIPVFLCPSDPAPEIVNIGPHDHDDELMVGRSNYSGVFGSTEIEDGPDKGNGAFFANSELKLSEFTDGLSNTMIVGERRNDFGTISWVGAVAEVDDSPLRIVGVADHGPNDPGGNFEDFRSYHPAGINVVLGDGSVHFVSNSIDEDIFRALATRNGGEVASIAND